MSHPPANSVPTKPKLGLYGGNVLVAAPSRWDEACFSAPVMRAIRSTRKTCTLGVVCHEEQGAFWRSLRVANQVLTYGGEKSYRALLAEQRANDVKWESAILWERNEAAELAVDLKVKQRLGYEGGDLRKWLTDNVDEYEVCGATEHRVQHYLRFADQLNLPTQFAELFQPVRLGAGAAKGRVLVSPESDYGASYEWEESGWLEVIGFLREKLGAEVVLVSVGGAKAQLAARIGTAAGLACARWDSLGGVLPLVAEHQLAICADSSMCHLAAHVGVTTISLFGPGNPQWRRPLGRQHAIVRRRAECSPCLSAKCAMDRRCQNELLFEQWSGVLAQKFAEC